MGKGYSLKAGTRYEYTTIEAYTQTEENIEIPSYGVMVPSVNLSKKLKAGTVKVAYNRQNSAAFHSVPESKYSKLKSDRHFIG